jgi:hypothetical protein
MAYADDGSYDDEFIPEITLEAIQSSLSLLSSSNHASNRRARKYFRAALSIDKSQNLPSELNDAGLLSILVRILAVRRHKKAECQLSAWRLAATFGDEELFNTKAPAAISRLVDHKNQQLVEEVLRRTSDIIENSTPRRLEVLFSSGIFPKLIKLGSQDRQKVGTESISAIYKALVKGSATEIALLNSLAVVPGSIMEISLLSREYCWVWRKHARLQRCRLAWISMHHVARQLRYSIWPSSTQTIMDFPFWYWSGYSMFCRYSL